MSTQRSHHGCWTCKRKRRRCDNTRPACENCRQRGMACEGYEVRLRWGAGIASRGRFAGADKPLDEAVPARPRGRRRDLSRERRRLEADSRDAQRQYLLGPEPDVHVVDRGPGTPSGEHAEDILARNPWSSNPQETALLREFLRSGINVLYSTTTAETFLASRLSRLCLESRALYAACIALQASFSEEVSFIEYFDTALATFRLELNGCGGVLHDGTWNAGLLLCAISLMRGFPWTLHLEGMHSILQGRAMNFMFHQETPERKHCLEVMGVMDLPTFSVGRQTPYIGLWHRYCRNRGDEGVEMVTGLPRSLLDIFSGIGQGTTVEDFWNWPGEQGSFLQCYLWEAHRLSGILNLRRYQTSPSMVGRDWGDASTAILRIHPHIPSREVLVTRVLANVDAIRRGCKEPGAKSTLIMNGINHPLFAAGLEVEVLNSHPEWKQLIRSCYYTDESGEFGAADRLQLQLLEEFWARNDMTLNANDLAREKGWELGLL